MICNTCDEDKPIQAFGKDRQRKSGRRGQCKVCRPKSNPIRLAAANLKHKFGLTLVEWNAMFETQDGRCAICNRPEQHKRLSVDHDHVTGKLRGLLCDLCNRGLGYFKDNTHALRSAVRYLEEYDR